MTFTFENANKIIDTYKYLLGKELSEGFTVDYISIVPTNQTQLAAYLSNLNQSRNPLYALQISGYDKSSVRVCLINHDKFRGNLYHSDIDNYLTKNNIEKCYDANGVFIES